MRFTSRIAAVGVAAAAIALSACVPEPTPAPPYQGEACGDIAGVTVVVDFAEFGGPIQVGCAEGSQANGMEALVNAGFTHSSGDTPGAVCQIDELPADDPTLCFTTGFWAYWNATPGSAWAFSNVGAGEGPIPAGSIHGWTWGAAPDWNAATPGVTTTQLGFEAVAAS